jgi:hypothetical protein
MTSGPALPCPKCRKVLEPISWHDADKGSCWSCRTDFSFVSFPAIAAKRPRLVAKAVLDSEHATCFYHNTNQAEAVCEACGRFACAICAVDFGGRRVCPPCIASANETDARTIDRRVLYDGIALGAAVLPILMWPLTLVTSPVALGFVVAGWRKPRSLVSGGGRTKLISAGLLALLQIGAWSFMLLSLLTRK